MHIWSELFIDCHGFLGLAGPFQDREEIRLGTQVAGLFPGEPAQCQERGVVIASTSLLHRFLAREDWRCGMTGSGNPPHSEPDQQSAAIADHRFPEHPFPGTSNPSLQSPVHRRLVHRL